MRAFFIIEYKFNKDELTEAEADVETALIRIRHISALWHLLKLIDVRSRWVDEDVISQRLDEFSGSINDLGDLGAAITDGLFGEIDSLSELLKKANAVAENVSIILDGSESEQTPKGGKR